MVQYYLTLHTTFKKQNLLVGCLDRQHRNPLVSTVLDASMLMRFKGTRGLVFHAIFLEIDIPAKHELYG